MAAREVSLDLNSVGAGRGRAVRVSGLRRSELQRCSWEVERVKCGVTKGLCARGSASRFEGRGRG